MTDLRVGDCREILPTLPAESVQCCVTSPPYWGLRDYGHAAQIGLEPTPEAFVEQLVAVFREVRRVLRDDGTLFLNLGDSYFASGRGGDTGRSGLQGSTASQDESKRGTAARLGARQRGTSCTAPQDSSATDFSCSDLCDGCAAALSLDIESTSRPPGTALSRSSRRVRDTSPLDSVGAPLGAFPPSEQESTKRGSSVRPSESCSHCGNCGACLEVLRSSSRDARLCVRTAQRSGDNAPPELAGRISRMDASGTAWVNYKPKDLMGLPWRVAFALQADGWWLRSDIIWSKPNPMPESVRDRPTKAHEYLFLLAKSEAYYYDAQAIAEPSVTGDPRRPYGSPGANALDGREYPQGGGKVRRSVARGGFNGKTEAMPGRNAFRAITETRNKRSVWTVPTQPTPDAHFATFPPKLVEPCILAGSRPGDVVLDPFAGTGTVGRVAADLGRRALLIELNPEYARMAERKTAQLGLVEGGA